MPTTLVMIMRQSVLDLVCVAALLTTGSNLSTSTVTLQCSTELYLNEFRDLMTVRWQAASAAGSAAAEQFIALTVSM